MSQLVSVYGIGFSPASSSYGSGGWAIDDTIILEDDVDVEEYLHALSELLDEQDVRVYSDWEGNKGMFEYGISKSTETPTSESPQEVADRVIDTARHMSMSEIKRHEQHIEVKREGAEHREEEEEYRGGE